MGVALTFLRNTNHKPSISFLVFFFNNEFRIHCIAHFLFDFLMLFHCLLTSYCKALLQLFVVSPCLYNQNDLGTLGGLEFAPFPGHF